MKRNITASIAFLLIMWHAAPRPAIADAHCWCELSTFARGSGSPIVDFGAIHDYTNLFCQDQANADDCDLRCQNQDTAWLENTGQMCHAFLDSGGADLITFDHVGTRGWDDDAATGAAEWGYPSACFGPTGYVFPDYYILSLIYAPPGCTKSSAYACSPNSYVNYGNTSTMGTTTSTQSSFQNNVTLSVSVLGALSLGGGYTETSTYGSSATFQKSLSTLIQWPNGNPVSGDGIDHDFDRFTVLLNPSVAINGWTDPITLDNYAQWAMGIKGPAAKNQYVQTSFLRCALAGEGPNPGGPYNPALYDPNGTCTLDPYLQMPQAANVFLPGVSNADYVSMLNQDPFWKQAIGNAIPIDTTRFTQQGVDFPYDPATGSPDTCETTVFTNSLTNSKTTSSSTQSQYEVDASLSVPLSSIFKLSSADKFTWSDTSSSAFTTMNTQTVAAQVSCASPAWPGPDQVASYYDNLFGTYLFTIDDGSGEVKLLAGRLINPSGQGLAGVALVLADGMNTYRTYSHADGSFTFNSLTTEQGPFPTSGVLSVGGALQTVSLGPQATATVTMPQPQTTLSWDSDADAASYNVYGGTAPGGEDYSSPLNATPIPAATTSYTDNVADCSERYYTIASVDPCGTSVQSAEVSASPEAPISTTATSAASTVTTAGTAVAVLGSYGGSGGEPALTYTWSAQGPGAVSFSDNADNTAKSTTASFAAAGNYVLTSTVANPCGQTTTSSVDVAVAQTLTSITVSPGPTLAIGPPLPVAQQFTATALDQFGNPMATQPKGFSWSLVGANGDSIGGATGLYESGTVANRTVTVQATSGAVSGTSVVTINPLPPAAPTGLSATGGDDQVTLAWTASAGASSYNVYRGTVAGGETLLGTGVTIPGGVDATATDGVAYFYQVTAVNPSGESPRSNEATATPAPAAPSAPTDLTATGGNNQVVLNWIASPGAIVYRVYRSTVSGGEGNPAMAGGIGQTSYTDSGALNGATYYYEVTAVNAAGASEFSSEASATPESAGPAAPNGLTAAAASGGLGPITLNWTASPATLVYRVYRSTVSGGQGNPALAGGIGTTNYVDKSVTAGVTYYYRVTAVSTGGASEFSNQADATLAPPAPTGLTAVAATGGIAPVSITWSASAGATGYDVYRGTVLIGTAGSAGATGTATAFLDTSAGPAGAGLSYTVQAVNTGGTSPMSSPATVGLAPAIPTALTATAGSNRVILNWTASRGALVYRVYRSTMPGGESNPALAGGLTSPAYTDTTAVNGTTYYYKVTAVNTAGASGFSNEAPATSGAVAAPAELTAEAAAGGLAPITLAWTPSPGALVYRVYRSTAPNGEVNPALAAGLSSTSYTDTAAAAGMAYYYKVTAVSTIGASAFSPEAGATLTPSTPTALLATSGTTGTAAITLAWTVSAGATRYNVYRGAASGIETLYATSSSPTYADSGVTPGATYFYTVAAVNAGGTSAYSNEVDALSD